MRKVIGIILSGGKGTRIQSDVPKQYIEIGNRSILSYSIETISNSEVIDQFVIVASEEYHEIIEREIVRFDRKGKFTHFVKPGAVRQLSIYNALVSLQGCEYVFIHDGARPLLTDELIERINVAIEGHDGVLPVLPMKDTVYLSEKAGCITKLLKRENVLAGQAPEMFAFEKYKYANELLIANDTIGTINGSTEVAILAGMDVVTVNGDENNFKITTNADIERFTEICRRREK